MSIAKILAPVTGGQRDSVVLANAVAAALPFNAHVMAFFVRPDLSEALAFFTDGVSGVVVDEVVKATKDAGDDAARRIEASVAAVCASAGIERVAQAVKASKVTLSLKEAHGNFGDALTSAARLSDLTVFGPIREGDSAGLAEAFVQVLALLEEGLVPALEWLVSSFERRTGISALLRATLARQDLAPDIGLVAYRTAQEALTNVTKHAHCSRVRVELSDRGHALTLEVSDNGRGFSPGRRGKRHSFGLEGLHERARSIGGWLDVSSREGGGTSITLTVPLSDLGQDTA